jgi:hypothetical protein
MGPAGEETGRTALSLADSRAALQVLTCRPYRPGYSHLFGEPTYHTRIALTTLSRGDQIGARAARGAILSVMRWWEGLKAYLTLALALGLALAAVTAGLTPRRTPIVDTLRRAALVGAIAGPLLAVLLMLLARRGRVLFAFRWGRPRRGPR